MRTGYSEQDRALTEKAHLAARRMIYPEFFGCDPDRIEYNEQGIEYINRHHNRSILPIEWLDSWMSIDRILRVPAPVPLGYVEFTIQERFERGTAEKWRNISITHFNLATENPSEFYKIKAHYFVSGYFDADESKMVGKAHVCNVERILKAVQSGALKFYKNNNHKNQDFLTFGYDDLESVGAVLMCADFRSNPVVYRFPDAIDAARHDELMRSIRELSRENAIVIANQKVLHEHLLKRRPTRQQSQSGNVIELNLGKKDGGTQ